MSQYCDPTDFDTHGVTDPKKVAACVKASGFADGFIGKRHKLPLISWGDDLRGNTADLAHYRTMKDRGFDPANPGDALIVESKKDAIAWLKMVASGEVELQDVVDSSATEHEASPLVESDDVLNWQVPSGADCEDA